MYLPADPASSAVSPPPVAVPEPASAAPVNPEGLVRTMAELVEATESITTAVENHDLDLLRSSTAWAEDLARSLEAIVAGLEPDDRDALDLERIAALGDRLGVVARRNAYLIENAWAVDAATLRLIMTLAHGGPAPADAGSGAAGSGSGSQASGAYGSTAPAAPYLERKA